MTFLLSVKFENCNTSIVIRLQSGYPYPIPVTRTYKYISIPNLIDIITVYRCNIANLHGIPTFDSYSVYDGLHIEQSL